MLLCLSPAWLTKVPAPGQPGEAALLVSKAVSFHPGGLTFLDDFVPPRRATYFLAGLGLGPGWGREAAELARDLTCPTGASAELARLLEAGVQSPGECVPKFPHPLLRKGQPCPGPATSQNTRGPWQQPAFHWTSCPAPEAGSGGWF